MKKGKIGKLAICLSSTLFFYTLTGCESNLPNTSSIDNGIGHDVWGVSPLVKVMRDKEDEQYYAEDKETLALTIDSARNEYEADQIIISANRSVAEYTLEISDLKQEDGDAVYQKENITVYNMKYGNVPTLGNDCGMPGYYPDCLLPFENAVEHGENKVAAGENQSIYFSFYVPKDQAVGRYTGTATLTVDGEKYDIPVTMRVRNVTVSEEVHLKSLYNNYWHYWIGEYDASQDMLDIYNKKLMEYRLMPSKFTLDDTYTQEEAEWYAEKSYEMGSGVNCSVIGIPVSQANTDGFKLYLKAMAMKSLETNCNLVAKCYTLGIDEPVHNGLFEEVKAWKSNYDAQMASVVAELINEKEAYLELHPTVTEEFYDEVVVAAGNVRMVTTTAYSESYEDYIDIWCPHYDIFEAGDAIGLYDGMERWSYCAGNPRYPYANYAVEQPVIACRMMGWLQSIHNIVGDLYWATTMYANFTSKGYQYQDEFYDEYARYGGSSGEGFLFYPGARYGVEGPLPSVRIESRRDGNEEYELMYDLQEIYNNVSQITGVKMDAMDTIENLASSLYSGMKVTATKETFMRARSDLLDFSEFTQSGVCFVSYSDNGEGVVEYEVYIPDGVALETDGVEAISERAVQDGKIVLYRIARSNGQIPKNAVFTTMINGEKVSFKRSLPGVVEKVEADQFVGKFTGTINAEGCVLVDGATLGQDGQYLALSLTQSSARQTVELSAKEIVSVFNAQLQKAVFNFYYTGETDLKMEMYVKYKNKAYPSIILSTTFTAGVNTLTWDNIYGLNWANLGEIEYIRFYVGEKNDPDRFNLYFRNMAFYYVKEDS